MGCVKIFYVEQNFADHVRHRGHLRLLHPAGGHGRGPQPEAAGLEGGAGLEGDGVLVHRDARFVQGDLAFLAGFFVAALGMVKI